MIHPLHTERIEPDANHVIGIQTAPNSIEDEEENKIKALS